MSSYAVGWLDGHKDQVMVSTILYICGLGGGWTPSGESSMSGIGGTGLLLGKTVAQGNSVFTWDTGSSGLSFIQKLDGMCLGYRTFETASGAIVRQQISAKPSNSPSATFYEHFDIYRASTIDTILEAKNRIKVNGWQKNKENKKEDEVTATADAVNPYLPSGWYVQQAISSGLIEKKMTADAGDGLSCEMVADWMLAELNVRRIRANFTTQRADNIAPGATIRIAATTRLGIDQSFWVQEVACEVNRSNQFTQNLVCIGVLE
jgi:hypothetical protein